MCYPPFPLPNGAGYAPFQAGDYGPGHDAGMQLAARSMYHPHLQAPLEDYCAPGPWFLAQTNIVYAHSMDQYEEFF